MAVRSNKALVKISKATAAEADSTRLSAGMQLSSRVGHTEVEEAVSSWDYLLLNMCYQETVTSQ